MYFFEDAQEGGKIEARLYSIVPSPPHEKISVSVEELIPTFNAAGLDPGQNDYTLWESMNNCAMGKNLKTILKNCLTAYQINFDQRELNKLGRDGVICLLFRIFDITPKSGKKTRPDRDSPEELSFWQVKILTDPAKRSLIPDAVDLAMLGDLTDPEAAMARMPESEQRSILARLLQNHVIPYDQDAFDDMPGRLLGKFFKHLLDAGRPASGEKTQGAPAQDNAASGEQTTKGDVEQPVRICPALGREEAQALYDAARKSPVREHLKKIDVTNIKIYDGMPITLKDHAYMMLGEPEAIFFGCVLLVNPNTGKVAASGHLEMGQKKDGNPEEVAPHLVFDAENMDFEELRRFSKFDLVLTPAADSDFFEQPMSLERAKSYPGGLYILEKIHRVFSDVPVTDRVLCIDFGTSNTTAGTWGVQGESDEKVSLVTFQDVTDKKPMVSELLPTMVYVNSCAPGREPEYLFGYEAKKKLIESDYAPEGTFFFEIKRWLNDMDKEEPIEDEQGNETKARREKIIFAYLNYVIDMAEQQFKTRFKKLHFSAPVKQKKIFLEWLEKIFRHTDKEVLPDDESLDEGMAIVYYTAMNYLKGSSSEMDILILDCGGGTTDLANCKCEYVKKDLTHELHITTSFENGDSNFGGNNITFRVMQMLKIKIARQIEAMNTLEHVLASGDVTPDKLESLVDKKVLSQDDADKLSAQGLPGMAELREFVQTMRIPMQDLIKLDENQILTMLDSVEFNNLNAGNENANKNSDENRKTIMDIKREIYHNFEKAYEEAEKYVPTRYMDYELRNEREMVRRNFYYLWQMAEAIKIKFYQTNIVSMDFAKNDAMDTIIDLGDITQYYLSVLKNADGALERKDNPLEHMEITCKEIDRILCADIYILLNILLDLDDTLKYSYCLSGQSCKIALFHNLLKEFIPGKNMRKGLASTACSSDTGSDILKKYCIEGSIEFNRDKARGSMRPEFHIGKIRHIYKVYFQDTDGEKPMFIPCGNDKLQINYVLRPKGTQELKLVIRDKVNVLKNEIPYDVFTGEQDYYNLEQLHRIISGEVALTDAEVERHVINPLCNLQEKYKNEDFYCFFSLPSQKSYGISLFQIGVKHKDDHLVYCLPDDIFSRPYENGELVTFFDGKR